MSQLVTDCPRCNTRKITFDLLQQNHTKTLYNWQNWFEVFCVCRHCGHATIFVLSQSEIFDYTTLMEIRGTVNSRFKVEGFINLKDLAAQKPPEHLPKTIEDAFKEGATCMATKCYNAGATMFRLCLDIATRDRLPPGEPAVVGLNAHIRRTLGKRLEWLFANGKLPTDLKDLSSCIKDDGNDGAHAGTIEQPDAENIQDFASTLLERLYTEPAKLALAKERTIARRQPSSDK